jgi:hypothetical protein
MKLTLLLFLLFYASSFGQNTISYTNGNSPPTATLSDVSWIAGHWKGEAFGGITEEIWSPPLGDSMMFVFKLVVDDKVAFYEIGHIRQEGETLILRLKHFNGNLTGWEEKDETVDFKLVKLEDDRAYFDDFTFEKINDSEMNIYVVIEQENGSHEEVKFNYKK